MESEHNIKLWDKEERKYVDVPNNPENRRKLAEQMKDPIRISLEIIEIFCQQKWESNKYPLSKQEIEFIESLGMNESDLNSICNREKLLHFYANNNVILSDDLLNNLINSVPNAHEILSKLNSIENKTETFSMRMTKKEMQLLNDAALKEAEIKNKVVTVTDVVREKLFPSDVNKKCFSDWDSFDMRKFESMTRSTEIENIINHPLKNMLTASKIFLHNNKMEKSTKDILLGKIPSIGKIYMNTLKVDDEATLDDVLNKMAESARDIIFDFMEKETIETLRKIYFGPEDYEPIAVYNKYSTMKNQAFLKIIQKNLPVAKILCGHEVFLLHVNQDSSFEKSMQRDVIMDNLYGHLGGSDVHVSNQIEGNEMFVLSSAENNGKMSYVWHIEPFKDSVGYGWNIFANINFSDIHNVGCGFLV